MPIEIILSLIAIVILLCVLIFTLSRYRKCPADKIMVIFGRVGTDKDGTPRTAKCMHGGAAFIFPVFQSYAFLDLTPIPIEIELKNEPAGTDTFVDLAARFTVGISTDETEMYVAAERLLGLPTAQIKNLATDIITGQLRTTLDRVDIPSVNRDKFAQAAAENTEEQLKKIGLKLLNANFSYVKTL